MKRAENDAVSKLRRVPIAENRLKDTTKYRQSFDCTSETFGEFQARSNGNSSWAREVQYEEREVSLMFSCKMKIEDWEESEYFNSVESSGSFNRLGVSTTMFEDNDDKHRSVCLQIVNCKLKNSKGIRPAQAVPVRTTPLGAYTPRMQAVGKCGFMGPRHSEHWTSNIHRTTFEYRTAKFDTLLKAFDSSLTESIKEPCDESNRRIPRWKPMRKFRHRAESTFWYCCWNLLLKFELRCGLVVSTVSVRMEHELGTK